MGRGITDQNALRALRVLTDKFDALADEMDARLNAGTNAAPRIEARHGYRPNYHKVERPENFDRLR
jgi:hypothetical protein